MPTCCSLPLWAAQVAEATPLPDRRLNTRLERLLSNLAAKPLDAFPQAAADWHQAKATYRFLANERFAWNDLFVGWQAASTQAMRGQSLVYVAHDTTTFTYTSLKHTTGLGYINQWEATRGIHCHSSLALRSDGVVLGLLHQHYWVREHLRKSAPNSRPREDKESIKWQQGLNATAAALDILPTSQRPRVIHLMDREGDIHEVFAKVLELGHGAIIRRYRNRAVAEWPLDADQLIRTVPVLARVKLKLPAGHGRKARTAVVELRSKAMTLSPNNHVERQRQPLRLAMVERKRSTGCCGRLSRHGPRSRFWPWSAPTPFAGGSKIFTWSGNKGAGSNNYSWRHGTVWKKRWSFMQESRYGLYNCVIWRGVNRPRRVPKC